MFASPEPSVTDHIKGIPTRIEGASDLTIYKDTLTLHNRVTHILHPEDIRDTHLPSSLFAAQYPGSSEPPRQILAGASSTPVQFFCQSLRDTETWGKPISYVTLSIGELYSYREKCSNTEAIILSAMQIREEVKRLKSTQGADKFVCGQLEKKIHTIIQKFRQDQEPSFVWTPSPGDIQRILISLGESSSESEGSHEQKHQIQERLAPCIAEIKQYQQQLAPYYHRELGRVQNQAKLGKEANAIISLDDTSTYIQRLIFAAMYWETGYTNRQTELHEHALAPLFDQLKEGFPIKPVYITQIEVAPASRGKGYSKALLDGIAWVSESGAIKGDLTYAIVEGSNPEKEKMISSFKSAGYHIYAFSKHLIHTGSTGIAYLALRINPKSPIEKITEK